MEQKREHRNYAEKMKKRNTCKNAWVEGRRVKNLASKNPKRSQKGIRPLRKKPNSRAERTSYSTRRGRRRNRAENYRETPP